MRRILFSIAPAFLLLAGLSSIPAGAALAEDSRAPGSCSENSRACNNAVDPDSRSSRRHCDEGSSNCEQKDNRKESRKAKCDADPKACEAKKAKHREKAASRKAQCASDPQACERKKQDVREKRDQRRRDEVAPAGQTPPTIPPDPQR